MLWPTVCNTEVSLQKFVIRQEICQCEKIIKNALYISSLMKCRVAPFCIEKGNKRQLRTK